MSIKARLGIAILGVAALAVALIGGLGLVTVRALIDAVETDLAQKAQEHLFTTIDTRARQNEALARLLASLPDIQARLRDNDRPGLIAELENPFAALKAYDVNYLHFHRPNTSTLARLHAPYQYDDDLSATRGMIAAVNAGGGPTRGLEVGLHGLAVRGAVPVVGADAARLGVVEVGSMIDADFLETLAEPGASYTIFVAAPGSLDVLNASLTARAPYLSQAQLRRVYSGAGPVTARSAIAGRAYLTTAVVLRNPLGQPIGVAQIDVDTTGLESAYARTVEWLLVGVAAIGLLAGLAAVATTLGILRPLERLLHALQAIAGDRLTATVPLLDRRDEMGDLARAIDGFRVSKDELRRARDQAMTASRVLQDVIDTVPAVINFKDRDLRYVVVNRSCAEFYGLRPEDMIGRRLSDMTCGLDMQALEAAEREVLRTGRPALKREFSGIGRSGRTETWWTVKAPARKDDGSIAGVVTVAVDMTELKEAQKVLERRTTEIEEANRLLEKQTVTLERLNVEYQAEREAALAANRAKSEFLANVSHELRTPLNAVIGYAEILTQQMFGPMPARYRDYSNDILVSGQHLLEVINDILDMSRIEAGTYTLRLQRLDLAAVIHEAVRFVRDRADKKQQILRLDTAEGLPWAQVDRRAIRQVVINLVGNAIKFTPTGGEIEVALTLKPGQGPEIAVRDNGPGIDPQHLPLVFQPFWQAEEARRRSHEGTGLGLSISHKLVDLHGGRIDIDSAVGRGTTVTVRLPPECLVAAPDPAGLTAPPV